jgi:hypothetical protein
MTGIFPPRNHRILSFERRPPYLILNLYNPVCQRWYYYHDTPRLALTRSPFPAPSHRAFAFSCFLIRFCPMQVLNVFPAQRIRHVRRIYIAGILVRVVSFSGVIIKLSRLVCVSRSRHVAGGQLVPRTVSRPRHMSSSTSLSASSLMY